MPLPPVSRCSKKQTLDFAWYSPDDSVSDPLEFGARRFVAALKQPGRLWEPRALAMARSEYKSLVKKAARGVAKPVEHVKAIRDTDEEHMFELRWAIPTIGMEVNDCGDVTKYQELWHMRQYHFEPELYPTTFVALHIHHKEIAADDAETEFLQDREIGRALDLYDDGVDSEWNLRFA